MSLIRGDALTIPLADDSVDLIVTSPPYFALRSYTDDGGHYAGQLGSEATPAAFIDALVSVTRECVRVLKPSGSLFVNLGDKYAASGGPGDNRDLASSAEYQAARNAGYRRSGNPKVGPARPKSLMGLPWRYALRCIDDLGLILRAEIIWSKPNGLPESVQDRVRRSHEQWFHFTLEPRYYSAVDEIREAQDFPNHGQIGSDPRGAKMAEAAWPEGHRHSHRPPVRQLNPLGKLPGSVWTIPTEPLRVPDDLPQHFAAFPSEWPRRIILGWSPSGICTVCGEGRRPVKDIDWSQIPHQMVERRVLSDNDRTEWSELFDDWWTRSGLTRAEMVPHFPHYKNGDSVTAQMSNWHRGKNIPGKIDWSILCSIVGDPPQRLTDLVSSLTLVPVADWETPDAAIAGRHKTKKAATLDSADYRTITGESCACPTPDAPTRPAVILDPFAGTGTTVAVANTLGRYGIGIDLSADYLKLARWRCQDPGLRAKVLGVDKPAPEVPGQMALL